MGAIYRVHEGNPMLQYYTNTLYYYTLTLQTSLVQPNELVFQND
jgi:hypothetical protein